MREASTINILLPVLNEEKRLAQGLERLQQYMEENFPGRYQIHVMDNGSTDNTAEIAKRIVAKTGETLAYIRCTEKGVGAAFREGVLQNTCDIVGYMDIDLSTDLAHIADVMQIFEQDCDVVNATWLSRKSHTTNRKWYRNLTSYGLTALLKLLFGMKASDSVCGFKFFGREAAKWLVEQTAPENGWLYIVECLLRAEKSGMRVVELPVRWQDDWNSNLKTWRLIRYYLKGIHSMWKRRSQMTMIYRALSVRKEKEVGTI